MFCEKCGTKLEDDMAFCLMCGAPVNRNDEEIEKTEILVEENNNTVQNLVVNEVSNALSDNVLENNTVPTQPIYGATEQEGMEPPTMPITENQNGMYVAQNNMYAPQNGMYTPGNKVKKNKSKKWILLLASIVIIAIVAAASILLLRKEKEEKTLVALTGYLDVDGDMYFVYENGNTVVIETGDNAQGWITADRKHIIILNEDSEVLIYDGKGKLQNTLEESATEILAVRDTGIVFEQRIEPTMYDVLSQLKDDYNDEWGTNYTYDDMLESLDEWGYSQNVEDAIDFYEDVMNERYDDENITKCIGYRYIYGEQCVEIDEYECILIAEEDLTIAYTSDIGVYLMTETEEKGEKIQGKKHDNLSLITVTKRGDILVWSDNVENDDTYFSEVYVASDGKVNSLGKMELEYRSATISACLLNDKKEILCISYGSEDVLYGTIDGGMAEKISLRGTTSPYNCYTQYDMLLSDCNKKIDGFYAIIDNDLFYISLEGERERLVTDVDSIVDVREGKIYYIQSDKLYCADVKKNELTNEECLVSRLDTYNIVVGENGKVYYIKDYYDNGDLYSITAAGDFERIGTDVSWIFPSSAYEKEPIYYAEQDYVENEAYRVLYIGEEKIQADVLTCVAFDEEYSSNEFIILQYDYVDDGDDGTYSIICNLCYYNGKKVERIASDIIYAVY